MINWHDIYGLKFEDGKLYFRDSPKTILLVQDIETMKCVESINLPLLGYIYSIIWHLFEDTRDPSAVISLHIPCLAVATIDQEDTVDGEILEEMINTLIEEIRIYSETIGFGGIGAGCYRLLQLSKYDEKTEMLSFRSPLMEMVIKNETFNEGFI